VEQVYGKQLRAAGAGAITLSGTGQIVKRVERFLAAHAIKFNKGSVAKAIRSELRQLPKLDAAPLLPEPEQASS
jgi:hypothetical protein